MRRFALLLATVSLAACGDDAQETTDDGFTTSGDPMTSAATESTSSSTMTTSPSTSESTSVSTTDPGTTESSGTTMVDPTEGTTMEDPTEGTTMEDPTVGTTMEEVTTSSSGDEGTTMMETEGDPLGSWADCFADDTACLGGETCIIATDMDSLQGSFCTFTDCDDVSDCAAAPPTGTAATVCEDAGTDGIAECYLSCAAGETCPDGMECWNAIACVWPETDWTCPLSLYDQIGLAEACDCGCGLTDPDCDDMSVESCEMCDNPGSCSEEACPGTIDALDNSICGV